MRKVRRFVIFLLLVGGGFAALYFGQKATEPVITSDLVGNQLLSAQELTTTKYMYTNAGAFENQNDFYGWKVPFTRKEFIVSYDGRIHAGVNLEEVDVIVSETTIQVTLPEVKILSHEIDTESLKVFDESSSIFNPLRIEDYKNFAMSQEKVVESEAIEKGLLVEATDHAQEAVRAVLEMNPDIAGQYTIEFK